MSEFYNQLGNRDHLLVGMTAELGDPWHGHGAFAGSVPVDEVLRVLTVNAEVVPTYVIDIDEPMGFRETGEFAVVDTDTKHFFQTGVTSTYKAPDYRELVDMLLLLMDAGKGEVEFGSVMALGHKQKAMVQVRPPEGVIVGGDHVLPWLAGASSLDSSWATTLKQCITRLECDNTAAMIMAERTATYKYKNTKNARFDLAKARDILGVFWKNINSMVAEIEGFQQRELTDRQFAMTIDKLYPMVNPDGSPLTKVTETKRDNRREALARMWVSDPRVSTFRGTVWGGIQAVSTATAHEFTVQETSGMTRTDRRAERTIDGKVDEINQATIDAINQVFKSLALEPV